MNIKRIGIPPAAILGWTGWEALRLDTGRAVCRFRNRCVAAICIAVGPHAGPARSAESFAIDANHTIPAFEVMHFGMTTQRGRFDRVSGAAILDFAERSGRVTLVIDMRSIDVGSESANRLLKSPLVLDVTRYPTMRFVSERLAFVGDAVVGAEGTLTLAGVTRPLHLVVRGFACRLHPLVKRRLCGADISATLRRSDFGLTGLLPDIGDLVRIDMPIEAMADAVNRADEPSDGHAPRIHADTGDRASSFEGSTDGKIFAGIFQSDRRVK